MKILTFLKTQLQQNYLVIVIIMVSWTFQAVLFTPQTYLINLRSPTPLTWWQSFVSNMILFYVWAVLTPPILWLGRIFPFERRHLIRNLFVHLVLSFVFAVVHIVLLESVNRLTLSWNEDYESPIPVMALVIGLGATNVINYWGVAAISQGITYFRRYKQREVSLVQAQLQSVQTQFHPHFLFNSLNVISELVHTEPFVAERTLTRLSYLLRLSLQSDVAQEITVREEIDFLRKYVEIQQLMMPDRLKIQWEIDPQILDSLVPNMLLQPIVENAIRHGISPKAEGGEIIIQISPNNSNLEIIVKDNGVGLNSPAKKEKKEGIGLKSVRTRLRHLYGEDHEVLLKPLTNGLGLEVRIVLPLNQVVED